MVHKSKLSFSFLIKINEQQQKKLFWKSLKWWNVNLWTVIKLKFLIREQTNEWTVKKGFSAGMRWKKHSIIAQEKAIKFQIFAFDWFSMKNVFLRNKNIK